MKSKFHEYVVSNVNERLRIFNIPKPVCYDLVEQLYICIYKNLKKHIDVYHTRMSYSRAKTIIGRAHNIPKRMQLDVIKELEKRGYLERENKKCVIIK